MDGYWTEVTLLCSALSALAGAGAKAFGDRLKLAHEDRIHEREREVSERDMWAEIGALRSGQERLHESLHSAEQRAADLSIQVAVLRTENEALRASLRDLSARYDRLRERYDALVSSSSHPSDNGLSGGAS